ncbi:MAG: MlaD family protein [Alphaproteobacteria bacterium]|nr:MlaD family protein [Alphaproteobacteria bacterium]
METRASYVVVGAFVFGLFAAALGFVVWLGKLELDHHANAFQIGFVGTVTGLSVGSPVRYRGIPVGQVSDIRLDKEDVERILVMIDVDAEVPIKRDAYAVLESQGLTGVGFIQIKGGSKAAPLLEPALGETVAELAAQTSVVEEVFESAPEIANQLLVLTNRAAAILNPRNQAALENILANLASVSGAFADEADNISGLVRNANEATTSLRALTEALALVVVSISDDLKDVAKETGQTMSALRGTVAGLDADFSTLSVDASRTLSELTTAADQARGLIAENRGAVRDFSQTGLYEMTQFLIEGRLLLENLNRVTRQLERDPAQILFGSRDRGVETSK